MIDAARVMQALAERPIAPDARQRDAIAILARLGASANATTVTYDGVYCYGLPGRGKSLVVDAAFAVAACEKRRVHFHEFLRDIHRQLVREPKCDDRLAAVANRWLDGVELLCFDEFHVHDIADAFLIGRFLDIALARRVRLVLTSNYAPQQLLPDPEFHERFEPTIAVILQRFAIVHFDGATDYRMGGESALIPRWISPLTDAHETLSARYAELEGLPPTGASEVTVAGRALAVRSAGDRVLWADFDALCVAHRSHLDYLGLAERWQTLIVDALHVEQLRRPDTLQRFLWLVDIAYDRQRTLLIASDAPLIPALDALSDWRDLSRTISRLAEMGSRDYERRTLIRPR
ncbi:MULTISPECIES: cell division protein ZapE [Pandoraea]|uniref:cell division protein ZapE n=1 Tax=Pandoraea TaxID=93217 RepID=UPI001F5D4776|nr:MULTISPECIES: cell division protein ZapE [Pandoraea]MCI3206050.1 cell division protein ZapE [Pandoraea sp. LA3]MDN4584078.1 cell division protein ZapE [Pandoraea capi]